MPKLRIAPRLELRPRPHEPFRVPEIRQEAEQIEGSLDDVLKRGMLSPHEKIVHVESVLLSRWQHRDDWRRYLDSPLLCIADAALTLKFGAAVAIKDAGVPYAKVFELMGTRYFEIDYSHHKRGMDEPVIDETDLQRLQTAGDVCMVDIDFLTGKTLTTVHDFLSKRGVNVAGAYIGLSRWPAAPREGFYIGHGTVDFDTFWKRSRSNGFRTMRNIQAYRHGLIPHWLQIFGPNANSGNNTRYDSIITRKIARHLY